MLNNREFSAGFGKETAIYEVPLLYPAHDNLAPNQSSREKKADGGGARRYDRYKSKLFSNDTLASLTVSIAKRYFSIGQRKHFFLSLAQFPAKIVFFFSRSHRESSSVVFSVSLLRALQARSAKQPLSGVNFRPTFNAVLRAKLARTSRPRAP